MKNNQFKKLAVLGASVLPLASAAFGSVDVGLSVSGGYRFDTIRRSGDTADLTVDGVELTHVSEKDKVGSLTVDLDAVIALNRDFYIRLNGNFGQIVSNPKETVSVTPGTSSTAEITTKNHCYGFGGAVGYQFDFADGEFALAPEFGYTYSRMKILDADFLGVGSPFLGLQFRWMFAQNWSMDLGANFHFLGSRHEKYDTADTIGLGNGYLKKGRFMGPEANLGFFYYIGESWTIGLKYRFKYLESDKRVYPEGATSGAARITNERTRWITNHAAIEAGYTF